MRNTKTFVLAMAAGGAALCLSRGDLAASGTIDTSGATIVVGDAPVQGTVVTDDAASLGAKPRLERPAETQWQLFEYGSINWFPEGASGFDPQRGFPHAGLGGANFVAQVDLTYPGGTYDYGSFTVERGVTVRFTGPTTLRTTGTLRIDGRIEMTGDGFLTLDCAGDATIVGRDDAVQTGLGASMESGTIVLAVGGALSVSADAGAHARFSAAAVAVYFDKPDAELATSISDAVFESATDAGGQGGAITIAGNNGTLSLTNCTTSGSTARVFVASQLMPPAVGSGDAASVDTLTISGGSFQGLWLWAQWGIRIEDGASITGDDWAFVAASTYQGSIHVTGNSTLATGRAVQLYGTSVVVGEGCVVRTTGDTPVASQRMMSICAGGNDAVGIVVEHGAVVENLQTDTRLALSSYTKIDVAGVVRGYGPLTDLVADTGDVAILDGADVDAPYGAINLWAAGAVTAAGGTATLAAREYDVRCITGDLDLDVATMDATAGRIVAMSNGSVRLRGAYTSAGDVQVISLADAIDVHGATLRTSETGSYPSGFVRLATYAATSIDAGDAAISTGDSQSQSGDVLIQTQQGGSAVGVATLKVARVTAKRTPDGVTVTRIQGTMAASALRKTELTGSAHLTAGDLSRRLYLQGVTGRIEGSSDTITVKLVRVGKTRVRFVIELRETSAEKGEKKSLQLSRAGFHAKGAFKRPRAARAR